jgi:hypothetical protein
MQVRRNNVLLQAVTPNAIPSDILNSVLSFPGKNTLLSLTRRVFGGSFLKSDRGITKMDMNIDALFAATDEAEDTVVTALNHQDIVLAMSAALEAEKVAVLHMLYPRTDARTHRSLDELVDRLHGHGLHQVARLVSHEAHYLVFKEPRKAWKAFHEIRHDSLAIGVHLYYRGMVGEAAERALDIDAHAKDKGSK